MRAGGAPVVKRRRIKIYNTVILPKILSSTCLFTINTLREKIFVNYNPAELCRVPLSSTHRFETRTTPFQHPKSLSSTPKSPHFHTKTPQFNTKTPSVQHQKSLSSIPLSSTPKITQFNTPLFNTFLMLNREVFGVELWGVLNWGVFDVELRGF